MDTLQFALKALYISLGGSADEVRNIEDIFDIILKIAALNIGDAVKTAKEFPEAPESDGAYVLTATVANGKVSGYKWESIGRTYSAQQ